MNSGEVTGPQLVRGALAGSGPTEGRESLEYQFKRSDLQSWASILHFLKTVVVSPFSSMGAGLDTWNFEVPPDLYEGSVLFSGIHPAG